MAAPRRGLILGIALLLAWAASGPAFAEAGGLVRLRFAAERRDAELEALLYLAAGVELADLGYSSSPSDKGEGDALTIEYALGAAEAELRLSLEPARGAGARPAALELTLHLDHRLEAELAGAIRELMAEARRPLAAAGGEAAGAGEIGGLFSSELVARDDALRTKKARRLESSVYGGGVLFIGDFSEYARYGATASLDAALLFLKRDWSLSLGLRASATRAFNAEDVSGGPLYLSSLGPNLRVGAGAAQAQRLSATISGGAAVLTVEGEGGRLSKAVPYFDAGAQAGLPIGGDFFLGAEARFMAAFEGGILILGIVPTISLCKEY